MRLTADDDAPIIGRAPEWRFDWTSAAIAFLAGVGVVALLAMRNGEELAAGQRDQLEACADVCAASCMRARVAP